MVFTLTNVKTTLFMCGSWKALAAVEELFKDWFEEVTDADNRSDGRDNSKEDVQAEGCVEILVQGSVLGVQGIDLRKKVVVFPLKLGVALLEFLYFFFELLHLIGKLLDLGLCCAELFLCEELLLFELFNVLLGLNNLCGELVVLVLGGV